MMGLVHAEVVVEPAPSRRYTFCTIFHHEAGTLVPMALNIKDRETEQLAGEVAALAGESKTGAVRQALRERKQRLLLAHCGGGRGDRMVALLEKGLWRRLPGDVRGRSISKQEEEEILGLGVDRG
jgi:antitoxin VapB